MKKRLLLFLCIFTLLLSTAAQAEDVTAGVPAPAPSAEKADTLSPFARTRSYDGRFTDVDASAWYHDAVAALYEYGLTEGVSSSAYAPEGSVTIAELVTFAARLHALERGAAIPAAAAGEAWYQPYVRYLKAEKCLGDELDGHYPEAATRAQMAGVLASALSAECYDERNAEAVTVGYASHRRITDVDDYTPYQSDILRLYKWGIVGGVDEDGSFHPNDTLKRSELAALVVRMVEPSARLTLSWQSLSYRSAAGTTWGDLIAAACRGLRRAGSRRRQRHRRADPKDAPRRQPTASLCNTTVR
ncbi:MAG: S-layer homology domain-containing protein [Oscillospiraceae bacterium]